MLSIRPKKYDLTADRRTSLNEELHDLSPNSFLVIKPRRIKWAGHVWGERNAYRILVREPPTSPRHRWEGNIKVDHQEIGSDAWTKFVGLRVG